MEKLDNPYSFNTLTNQNNKPNKKHVIKEEETLELEAKFSHSTKTKKFFFYGKNFDLLDENKNSLYISRKYNLEDLKTLLAPFLHKTSGIMGIKNTGNTCYINTVIQCLLPCLDMLVYIIKKDYVKDINPKSPFKGKLATQFFSLFEAAWTYNPTSLVNVDMNPNVLVVHNEIEEQPSLNITFFKGVIQGLSSLFSSNLQNDPHELLVLLLEGLDKDLSKRHKKDEYKEGENDLGDDDKSIMTSMTNMTSLTHNNSLNLQQRMSNARLYPKQEDESEITASRRFWIEHRQQNPSYITELFTGQTKKTLICPECVNTTITYDHFTTLDLAIPVCSIVTFCLVMITSKSKSQNKSDDQKKQQNIVINLPIPISDMALFFDAERYINAFLKTKNKKFRYLLSNNVTQRLVKSSENIVSLSKKGKIMCFEIDQELYGDDYFPLLLHFVQKKEEKQPENMEEPISEDHDNEQQKQEQIKEDKKKDKKKKDAKQNKNKSNKNNKDTGKNNKDSGKDTGTGKESKNTNKDSKQNKDLKKDENNHELQSNSIEQKELQKHKSQNKEKKKEKKIQEKKNSYEYITYSRLLPIMTFFSIEDIKVTVFACLLPYLSYDIEKFLFADYEKLLVTDEDDPEYRNLLIKMLKKLEEVYAQTKMPFSVFLTTEKTLNSTEKSNSKEENQEESNKKDENKQDNNEPANIVYLFGNGQADNDDDKPSHEAFKNQQPCEDLIKIMKNGMKLYILMNSDHEQYNDELFSKNLNKSFSVKLLNKENKEILNDETFSPSLKDCVMHYQLIEKMDKQNELFCVLCQKKQQFFVRQELFYCPRNLIIVFKRYQQEILAGKIKKLKKNDRNIRFPVENMTLESYIPRCYELFSVCQHSGSMEGGHNFTNIKNRNRWYGIDDNSVYPSEAEGVVIPEAYMLFYRSQIKK